MPLSPSQQKTFDSFKKFLASKDDTYMCIAGHSGCGKTYLTTKLEEAVVKYNTMVEKLTGKPVYEDIVFTSTTHTAASVLSLHVQNDCSTIHSLLRLSVSNDFHSGTTRLTAREPNLILENLVIFIDEASRIDDRLMGFIRKFTHNCKIIFIMDDRQTLNIGQSTLPARDNSTVITRLTDIMRQGEKSNIRTLGAMWRDAIDNNDGTVIIPETHDVQFLEIDEFQKRIVNDFQKGNNPDAKILAWTNKTVQAYNNYCRNLSIKDPAPIQNEILVCNNAFHDEKGKVALRTETEITVYSPVKKMTDNFFNMEVYMFDALVSYKGLVTIKMPVDFTHYQNLIKHYQREKNWEAFFRLKNQYADLRPTFASTIYKAQGKTFKRVYINLKDVVSCRNLDQVLRMLYVGSTRPTEEVFFYGPKPIRFRQD